MATHLLDDPRLPILASLLDEAAVMTALTAAPPAVAGYEIAGCRPCYVRYKPGTTCLVQYDLTLTDARGERNTLPAHIKVFADDRADRHAVRTAMRFASSTARLQRAPSLPRVAYVAALDGLLQIYPVDRDLRFLVRAADARRMTKSLRAAHPDFADASVRGEPELIRYKPERKALLRYTLRHGPVARWYGKLHVAARNDRFVAQARLLREAGVATPPVLIALPSQQFVAHAEAPGVQLASLRGDPALASWMAPLARTLRRMQQVAIPGLPVHAVRDIGAEIERGAGLLARIVPRLAPRLWALRDGLTARLAHVDERWVTCHGDFYDDQALVGADGLTLIDLDEMRLSHPLLDAGNLLAHLTIGADRDSVSEAARADFHAAVMTSGVGTAADLALFEALAVLKLAPGPFRRLEADWPERIERVLDLAAACLDRAAPARRWAVAPKSAAPGSAAPKSAAPGLAASGSAASGSAGADPALPQLGALQDRATMSAKLATATDDSALTITRVDLIRHKVGRRAVLRYEITGQNAGEARGGLLYGKTFASGRGPRVTEISRRICAAAAFGPDVSLPEPVAFLPEVKLLVQKPVPGVPAQAGLLRDDPKLAAAIATSLHRFHTSGLDLGRAHDLTRELSPLPMRADQVVVACPELRSRVAECLTRIDGMSPCRFPWRWRPIHRDFYHDQVLVDDGKLAVLDLDDAARSEPAVDVANFTAHLILLRAEHHAHAAALTAVARAFLTTYRRLDPALDRDLTRFLIATTLVRLAGIHVGRANGPTIATALLDRAWKLLGTAGGVHRGT